MMSVPGSKSSLLKEKAKGTDIRIVYSPVDSLKIAKQNPSKEIVFLGVGFETTSPAVAATVLLAQKKRIKNFSVLPMFKLVIPALRTILMMKKNKIDGFILPGHVSTIIGSKPYEFIPDEFGIPCVIAGFEPKDILTSIKMVLKQIKEKRPSIEIEYVRAVNPDGNKTAVNMINQVFNVVDSNWRAIGNIPESGLSFNSRYADFDAIKKFPIKILPAKEPKNCSCGDILLGLKTPIECVLFGKKCTPSNPIGPCMVSSEGSCAAVFKYAYI